MTIVAFVLALVWGAVWALALQTKTGRFLSARYTWITVVIGVGVDLLIALLVVPFEQWAVMALIMALSSLGIIVRSLWNEQQDHNALSQLLNGDEDTRSK